MPWYTPLWKPPVDDIITMYHTVDKAYCPICANVTKLDLEKGFAILLAELTVMHGVSGTINAGRLLISRYVAPFITEQYEDFIRAGVDDSG